MFYECEIIVEPELRDLIPPQTSEERQNLTAALKENGCLDPLRLWKDGERHVLLDGHNRKEVCEELGIKFDVVIIDTVESKADAVNWLIDNQLGRRNLSPEQKGYLRGKR